MTFESVDSREGFEEELLSRLESLSPDKLALFGLSACEHMRSFIADLASVAPAADELISALWEQDASDQTFDFDASLLEHAIADHTDALVEDELEALALPLNAGLGLGLSLLADWAAATDASVLVRMATVTVAEFSEISSVEAAESVELTSLAEWLRRPDADGNRTRERARAHGQELARLAWARWLID